MREAEPSDELKKFCKGAILHQLGHVLGLTHEHDIDKDIMLHESAIKSDYLNQV